LEDREEEIRYEVELMLGSLNESHIIRTIEYWDIERRRYPAYDHRAVVIAEDITSRFLNVIQLFSGSIPLIALQVNCVRVGEQVTLVFLPLLVSTELRIDDRPEIAGKGADRAYWINRVGQSIVTMADELAAIVNNTAQRKRALTYQKQYIGLADGGSPNNFVYFRPKKSFIGIRAKTDNNERWVKAFEAIGLDATIGGGRLKVNVTPELLSSQRRIIEDLLAACVKEDEG